MSIHKQVIKQAEIMAPGNTNAPIMNHYYSFILNIQV